MQPQWGFCGQRVRGGSRFPKAGSFGSWPPGPSLATPGYRALCEGTAGTMAVSSGVRPQSVVLSGEAAPTYMALTALDLNPGSCASYMWSPGPLCASGGTDGGLPPSSHLLPSHPESHRLLLLPTPIPAAQNTSDALSSPPIKFCPPALLPDVGKPRPKEWKC